MNKIHHVFYINLEKRTDRREQIEKEILDYGLNSITERYDAIHTPHSGIVGCGYSHLNVLKIAREREYENVLILEDDFQFTVSKETMENMFSTLYEKYPHFDVCMISYVLQQSVEIPNCDFLKRVLNGQTASGYIVNKHYYNTLIELYDWAIPLLEKTGEHWKYANDQVWKLLQRKNNWVCFTKKMGIQRDGYSDNKMCNVSYKE